MQSDLSNASKQIKIFQATNGSYPVSVTDCPNPATTNLCLKSSGGSTYTSWVYNNTNLTYTLVETASDNKTKYQINEGSGLVATAIFTGILVAMGTPTIATGSGPYNIAISPDGTSVYLTNHDASTCRKDNLKITCL